MAETDEIPNTAADEIPTDEIPTELSLDDLFQQGVAEDEINKGNRDVSLPVGTYTTEQPPIRFGVKKDDSGRLIVNGFFKITNGDVKGAIGYRFSPERKNAVNRETGELTDKPDRAYRNYLQAHNAYVRATGSKPASVGEVAAYVRDYPVRLRVIQLPDGENMVVALSPVI